MTRSPVAARQPSVRWQPIIDVTRYDLDPVLRSDERKALRKLVYQDNGRICRLRSLSPEIAVSLRRLTTPIDDAIAVTGAGTRNAQPHVARALLRAVRDRRTAYWTWTSEEWWTTICQLPLSHRTAALVTAYLIAGQRELHPRIPGFHRRVFARTVLGHGAVEDSIERVERGLRNWGFSSTGNVADMRVALCELMLRCATPLVEDLTPQAIVALHDRGDSRAMVSGTRALVSYLVADGILDEPPIAVDVIGGSRVPKQLREHAPGVPDEWAQWCRRWLNTTTLQQSTRRTYYINLLKAGRWLAAHHPEATDPANWTRALAAEWVAAVDGMNVGDWADPPETHSWRQRRGSPLAACSKAHLIGTLRAFFRDCKEWGWIPTRFDPTRALATPRSIYALIGPKPRVIADDIWAKLLWAGLNLTDDDLPRNRMGHFPYPFELVRAVTVMWLFSGLRSNEVARLPLGCIRWQQATDQKANASDPARICLLDVPVHKTGTSFTKPVDAMVGEAIVAWEAVRPSQPSQGDAKTGELVDFLFSMRGRRISVNFINHTIIRLLCRKANLPDRDARGAITSHRARATIATQLYNAKNPMTLFELQAWLGHRSPSSTQHYAAITPTKLAKAYTDAGYFARNIRAIEVLVDRDVVASGAAAGGTPWQHYDLGHGYCTYDFFAQCPHRMACARCDFYVPKASSKAQLLEAKANVQRMLVEIPLIDDERAAVDNDAGAVERLLHRLADVPTPTGPTPRMLSSSPVSVARPVVAPDPTEPPA